MTQSKIAILFMVLAVVTEYIYYFQKKKQEKNLAKNILGDILMVAGEVLFWAQFPKTYTRIELTIQSVLVLLYFGTMGYVAVAAKVKELRKEE